MTSSLTRRAGSVPANSGSPGEETRRVRSANSWRSTSAASISRWRSKSGRVHGPVKSRHCARSQAARRSRSIGPSSPPKADRRRARRTPSGGSASCSCNQRPNASSNRRAEAGSVSTSKSGSTPASTGRSRNRSAQNPWMVLTCASSRPVSARLSRVRVSESGAAALRARSSRARSRSFSSPAAFSVNVTATICPTVARPSARIVTIRPTSSVVFPVPAAASTIRVSSSAGGDRVTGFGVRQRHALMACPQRLQIAQRLRRLARDMPRFVRPAHRAEVAPSAGARRPGRAAGIPARSRDRRSRAPRGRRGGWPR